MDHTTPSSTSMSTSSWVSLPSNNNDEINSLLSVNQNHPVHNNDTSPPLHSALLQELQKFQQIEQIHQSQQLQQQQQLQLQQLQQHQQLQLQQLQHQLQLQQIEQKLQQQLRQLQKQLQQTGPGLPSQTNIQHDDQHSPDSLPPSAFPNPYSTQSSLGMQVQPEAYSQWGFDPFPIGQNTYALTMVKSPSQSPLQTSQYGLQSPSLSDITKNEIGMSESNVLGQTQDENSVEELYQFEEPTNPLSSSSSFNDDTEKEMDLVQTDILLKNDTFQGIYSTNNQLVIGPDENFSIFNDQLNSVHFLQPENAHFSFPYGSENSIIPLG